VPVIPQDAIITANKKRVEQHAALSGSAELAFDLFSRSSVAINRSALLKGASLQNPRDRADCVIDSFTRSFGGSFPLCAQVIA
jgi:hypothetical protein